MPAQPGPQPRPDARAPLLAGAVAGHAARTPGRAAVLAGRRALSWAELLAAGRAAADALRAAGVGPGDPVAPWPDGRPAGRARGAGRAPGEPVPGGPGAPDPAADLGVLVVLLAADLLGAVTVLVDPAWPAAVRDAALRAAGARRVVLRADGSARPVGAAPPPGPPTPDALPPGVPPPGALPPGAALVAFTSGSGGAPRGVWRTAGSWTASFPAFGALVDAGPDDVVATTGPLHGTLALFGAVHALHAGAAVRLGGPWPTGPAAPAGRAGPAEPMGAPATVVHGVPAALRRVLDAATGAGPGGGPGRGPGAGPVAGPSGGLPRLLVSAGAVLPDSLAARAAALGVRLVEYYGAAELSLVAAREVPAPLRALPGVEVRVRDGVLWARSPFLAGGYAAPAASPGAGGRDGSRPDGGPLRRDADGFATVGDRAATGPDGTLRVHGRGDAAVSTGGHTVLPEDVERVLCAVPGVADAVVLGTPHPHLGEVVTAVLELVRPAVSAPDPGPDPGPDPAGPAPGPAAPAGARAAGSLPALADLRAAVAAALPAPARPRLWWAVDALPRTGAGKAARAAVAAGLADGTLGARRLP